MRTFREYLKSIPSALVDAYSEREIAAMQEGWSAALESVLGSSGEKIAQIPILSKRITNALEAAGVDLQDLRGMTFIDFLKIPGLGKKSVREIMESLEGGVG